MSKTLAGALENLLNKIEEASARSVQQTGEFVEQEFSELVQKEVYEKYSPKAYERTGAMGETPKIAVLKNDYVKIEFRDLGNWYSRGGGMPNYKDDGQPFFAMIGLEQGTTWNRPASNIMKEVASWRFKSEIADEYKEAMLTQGIPIK